MIPLLANKLKAVAGVDEGIISLPNLEWYPRTRDSYSDFGTTPAVNNDPIRQLNDSGPNEHNLLQTTDSQRPTFKTNVVNGLSVTRYSGTVLMAAGDILDSVFVGADKKFSIHFGITDYSLIGLVWLPSKYAATSNDRQLLFLLNAGKLQLNYYQDGGIYRVISADDALDGNPHVLSYYYNDSIDTGDGLDRVVFEVDNVPVDISLIGTSGGLPTIQDKGAQLTVGSHYLTAPATSPSTTQPHDIVDVTILSTPSVEDRSFVNTTMMTEMGL